MALNKQWVPIQTNSGSSSLDSQTFDSTGFDAVYCVVKWEGTDTTVSVTDNKGSGTFTPLTKVNHSNGDLNIQGFWATIGSPGTGHILTATFGTTHPWQTFGLWLINSSTDTPIVLDTESVAQGSGSVHDAGTLVTSAASAMFATVGGYNVHDHTESAGWTLDAESFAGDFFAWMSRVEAAAGTFDPEATSNGASDWVGVSAAFKESGGAAPSAGFYHRSQVIWID